MDDAPRWGRPAEVDRDQIETLRTKLRHMGDSRHTQNIQIKEVMGENEKCVVYGKN